MKELKQQSLKISNKDWLGFNQAIQLINAAEKYPTKNDESFNILDGDISWPIARLTIECAEPIKAIQEEQKKISKKYEKFISEEGRFTDDKEGEKYDKEMEKLLEKEEVRLMPMIPHPSTWGGFKCSTRVYVLLDKLYFKEKPKESAKE